ncbi:MAG: hypothetical protein WDO69_26020 [Pseudomonadota bacterium]
MGGLPFRLLKGSGALLVAVLAGCGGRSSTLDSDDVNVEPSQPDGGSTGNAAPGAGGGAGHGPAPVPTPGDKGGSPSGGATSVGSAGSAPAGGASSAGAASGGASAVDPATYSSCNNYCSAVTQSPCPNGLAPDQCTSSCLSDLGAQSLECQKTGQVLIDCLITVFKNSDGCAQVEDLTAAKCSGLLTSYQSCSRPIPDPMPAPLPTPVPIPGPLPAQTCSSSGSSGNGTCNLDVKCDSGAYYSVYCSQTSPAQSSCTCSASFADGSGSGSVFGLNENATFACYDSLATCGFPQTGLK